VKRCIGLLLTATATLLAACAPSEATDGRDLAVLAQGAEGFAEARPGAQPQFPRDHGAHPDYRIEWWYLTANLQDAEGLAYGAQWTLFRFADRPAGDAPPDNPWQSPQIFMAHFALTTPDDHAAFQRYARGGDHAGLARAGARSEPFAAWLDDWSLQSTGAAWLPLQVQAQQGGYGMRLQLESDSGPVLQGDDGFSQKHPGGGGSWYYSQPFLQASGQLLFDGLRVEVSGQAWLDREWSSQFLQADQAGWDWFALHLDSGEKLMLFRLRGRDNRDFRHAVLIRPDGEAVVLDPERLELTVVDETRVAGRPLPLHWRIGLPDIGRSLQVKALHPGQWMALDFPYWEGVVVATGVSPGERGVGYLELTGYAPE
jgi:predicted secreted hydrolase